MMRRQFLTGVAALAAGQARAAPFADGQSVIIEGREHVLTDIVAPAADEPGGEIAVAVVAMALAKATRVADAYPEDRWGRLTGAVQASLGGRRTTLQEIMLGQGAARVSPQSYDFDFIERCLRVEQAAREARLGIWRLDSYRVREAESAERSFGFQIYQGVVRTASERGGRTFFNFGDDFRTDFTASAARSDFRRWRNRPELQSFAGKRVQIRGLVEWINGPSIELRHELQLRVLD